MATATAINPAAWQTRAKELCDAANLRYTARYLHTEQAFEVFAVPTKDRSGEHTVTHDLLTGAVRCDCRAGEHGVACCHSGAVIVYCEARTFAFSEAGMRGQRQYEAFADELERRVTSLPIEHIGHCDLCNEVARLYTYEDDFATVYFCGDCGADDLSA